MRGYIPTANTDQWETPRWLFEEWDKKYKFTLDVCASESNKKCERYFDERTDGLFQLWEGNIWMNPPYGRDIIKWVRKAFIAAHNGHRVVCLLPARTDTKWFHHY